MTAEGYPESALVTNRASTIVYGGSDTERRAWAEEAAGNFELEGPLRCAEDDAALVQAFATTRGVVFIPDISRIGISTQGELCRILREREERPKFVLGLRGAPLAARDQGLIRWDLAYALHRATVNLDEDGLLPRIHGRRARAPKRVVPAPIAAPPRKTSVVGRSVVKTAPKRAVSAKTSKVAPKTTNKRPSRPAPAASRRR